MKCTQLIATTLLALHIGAYAMKRTEPDSGKKYQEILAMVKHQHNSDLNLTSLLEGVKKEVIQGELQKISARSYVESYQRLDKWAEGLCMIMELKIRKLEITQKNI
jgi:hypothetical protein